MSHGTRRKQRLESNNSEDDAYWTRFMREAAVNQVQAAKDGAKQLVAITSALLGLFGVLPLRDLSLLVNNRKILLFLIPSLFWLVGLVLSVVVLVPEFLEIENEDDNLEIKKAIRIAASKKLRLLRTAQWSLVSGLFMLLVVIAVYSLTARRG